MSALLTYAKSELNILYKHQEPDNDYDRMRRDAVLEMVETFSKQGHSGFSASWVLSCIEKLLAWEPLTPLTGEDDEWTDIGEINDSPCWQNKRCSRVFKDGDGNAYDIQGRVFVEANGSAFTNQRSRTYISFPYTPVTEYVNVDENGNPLQ